jgi:glutathione S-transferase
MKLYHHPISTYSQKVLIAFAEKGLSFKPEIVELMNPAAKAEYKKINPHGKVPMLVLDDGWKIPESTIIVEYLEGKFPKSGTRLIPEDVDLARRARFLDRMADLYMNETMTTILFDGMKPEAEREPKRVAAAKATLDINYPLMDKNLESAKGPWLLGEHFSLADCSAAPCLFYLRQVHPYTQFKNIEAYWNRVSERPSVKQRIDAAMPYLAKMNAGK